MRIAVTTWTRRQVGGVETYLAAVVPALQERGHQVGILHEVDTPQDRDPITASASVPHWSAADSPVRALDALRSWKPDVVFAQGMEDPDLEARAAGVAPAVFFAHAYRGTCISGTKSCALPVRTACERTLDWPCLLHYLPRRCGGSSPQTMVRLYRRESRRRALFERYAAVVAFSEHIRRECVRHGVTVDRTHVLPAHVGAPAPAPRTAVSRRDRVLFVGRMEPLKGGRMLLDALPLAERALGRPLQACFAGDGGERDALETRARAQSPGRIEFTGWVDAARRNQLFEQADLLVVPSLWPEPFGLIGVEAAVHGVPAAAFNVGGIPQWLTDGVNGHLAPAAPPSAAALASAMTRCLADPAHHARLSDGAVRMAARHTLQAHVASLAAVLAGAAPVAGRNHIDDPAA